MEHIKDPRTCNCGQVLRPLSEDDSEMCGACVIEEWAEISRIESELLTHLETLEADLEVELDLHGGRTEMAYNLRTLITKTRKELEEVTA